MADVFNDAPDTRGGFLLGLLERVDGRLIWVYREFRYDEGTAGGLEAQWAGDCGDAGRLS